MEALLTTPEPWTVSSFELRPSLVEEGSEHEDEEGPSEVPEVKEAPKIELELGEGFAEELC